MNNGIAHFGGFITGLIVFLVYDTLTEQRRYFNITLGIAIGMGIDPLRMLVLSQVVLSFQLPFAIVPLIMFTSDKKLMGSFANKKWVTIIGSLCAVIIIALNIYLIFALIAS